MVSNTEESQKKMSDDIDNINDSSTEDEYYLTTNQMDEADNKNLITSNDTKKNSEKEMAGPMLTTSSSSSSLAPQSKVIRRPRQEIEIFPWLKDIYKEIRSNLKSHVLQSQLLKTMSDYIECIRNDIHSCIRFPNRSLILSKNISRMLLLFKDLNKTFYDSDEYLLKVCELLGIYTRLELKYSTKFVEPKQIVVDRISLNYDLHLQDADNIYIVRVFLHIKHFFLQKEIMCEIFQKYLKKPRKSKKLEMTDKIYVMYLIAFKYWRDLENDHDERLRIDDCANSLMQPTSTLRANLSYAPFLPVYKTKDEDITKYILSQYFQPALLLKAVRENEMLEGKIQNIEQIVDLSLSDQSNPMADNILQMQSANSERIDLTSINTICPRVKLEKPEVVATIDLTLEERLRTETVWIEDFLRKARAAEPITTCSIENINNVIEIIEIDDDVEEINATVDTTEKLPEQNDKADKDSNEMEVISSSENNSVNLTEKEAKSDQLLEDNSISAENNTETTSKSLVIESSNVYNPISDNSTATSLEDNSEGITKNLCIENSTNESVTENSTNKTLELKDICKNLDNMDIDTNSIDSSKNLATLTEPDKITKESCKGNVGVVEKSIVEEEFTCHSNKEFEIDNIGSIENAIVEKSQSILPQSSEDIIPMVNQVETAMENDITTNLISTSDVEHLDLLVKESLNEKDNNKVDNFTVDQLFSGDIMESTETAELSPKLTDHFENADAFIFNEKAICDSVDCTFGTVDELDNTKSTSSSDNDDDDDDKVISRIAKSLTIPPKTYQRKKNINSPSQLPLVALKNCTELEPSTSASVMFSSPSSDFKDDSRDTFSVLDESDNHEDDQIDINNMDDVPIAKITSVKNSMNKTNTSTANDIFRDGTNKKLVPNDMVEEMLLISKPIEPANSNVVFSLKNHGLQRRHELSSSFGKFHSDCYNFPSPTADIDNDEIKSPSVEGFSASDVDELSELIDKNTLKKIFNDDDDYDGDNIEKSIDPSLDLHKHFQTESLSSAKKRKFICFSNWPKEKSSPIKNCVNQFLGPTILERKTYENYSNVLLDITSSIPSSINTKSTTSSSSGVNINQQNPNQSQEYQQVINNSPININPIKQQQFEQRQDRVKTPQIESDIMEKDRVKFSSSHPLDIDDVLDNVYVKNAKSSPMFFNDKYHQDINLDGILINAKHLDNKIFKAKVNLMRLDQQKYNSNLIKNNKNQIFNSIIVKPILKHQQRQKDTKICIIDHGFTISDTATIGCVTRRSTLSDFDRYLMDRIPSNNKSTNLNSIKTARSLNSSVRSNEKNNLKMKSPSSVKNKRITFGDNKIVIIENKKQRRKSCYEINNHINDIDSIESETDEDVKLKKKVVVVLDRFQLEKVAMEKSNTTLQSNTEEMLPDLTSLPSSHSSNEQCFSVKNNRKSKSLDDIGNISQVDLDNAFSSNKLRQHQQTENDNEFDEINYQSSPNSSLLSDHSLGNEKPSTIRRRRNTITPEVLLQVFKPKSYKSTLFDIGDDNITNNSNKFDNLEKQKSNIESVVLNEIKSPENINDITENIIVNKVNVEERKENIDSENVNNLVNNNTSYIHSETIENSESFTPEPFDTEVTSSSSITSNLNEHLIISGESETSVTVDSHSIGTLSEDDSIEKHLNRLHRSSPEIISNNNLSQPEDQQSALSLHLNIELDTENLSINQEVIISATCQPSPLPSPTPSSIINPHVEEGDSRVKICADEEEIIPELIPELDITKDLGFNDGDEFISQSLPPCPLEPDKFIKDHVTNSTHLMINDINIKDNDRLKSDGDNMTKVQNNTIDNVDNLTNVTIVDKSTIDINPDDKPEENNILLQKLLDIDKKLNDFTKFASNTEHENEVSSTQGVQNPCSNSSSNINSKNTGISLKDNHNNIANNTINASSNEKNDNTIVNNLESSISCSSSQQQTDLVQNDQVDTSNHMIDVDSKKSIRGNSRGRGRRKASSITPTDYDHNYNSSNLINDSPDIKRRRKTISEEIIIDNNKTNTNNINSNNSEKINDNNINNIINFNIENTIVTSKLNSDDTSNAPTTTTITDPPKRKRGRPKGSKNKKKINNNSSTTSILINEQYNNYDNLCPVIVNKTYESIKTQLQPFYQYPIARNILGKRKKIQNINNSYVNVSNILQDNKIINDIPSKIMNLTKSNSSDDEPLINLCYRNNENESYNNDSIKLNQNNDDVDVINVDDDIYNPYVNRRKTKKIIDENRKLSELSESSGELNVITGISKTYSNSNSIMKKVFVPPDIESIIQAEENIVVNKSFNNKTYKMNNNNKKKMKKKMRYDDNNDKNNQNNKLTSYQCLQLQQQHQQQYYQIYQNIQHQQIEQQQQQQFQQQQFQQQQFQLQQQLQQQQHHEPQRKIRGRKRKQINVTNESETFLDSIDSLPVDHEEQI